MKDEEINPPDGRCNGAAVDAWQASPILVNTTITNNRELGRPERHFRAHRRRSGPGSVRGRQAI
jgi:hypothetical protein